MSSTNHNNTYIYRCFQGIKTLVKTESTYSPVVPQSPCTLLSKNTLTIMGVARSWFMNDQELLYQTAEDNPAMTTTCQDLFMGDYCKTDDNAEGSLTSSCKDAIQSADQPPDPSYSSGSLPQEFTPNLEAQSSNYQNVSDHFIISEQDVPQSPNGGEIHVHGCSLDEQLAESDTASFGVDLPNFETDVLKLQTSSSVAVSPSKTTLTCNSTNETPNLPSSLTSIESDTYIVPLQLDDKTFPSCSDESSMTECTSKEVEHYPLESHKEAKVSHCNDFDADSNQNLPTLEGDVSVALSQTMHTCNLTNVNDLPSSPTSIESDTYIVPLQLDDKTFLTCYVESSITKGNECTSKEETNGDEYCPLGGHEETKVSPPCNDSEFKDVGGANHCISTKGAPYLSEKKASIYVIVWMTFMLWITLSLSHQHFPLSVWTIPGPELVSKDVCDISQSLLVQSEVKSRVIYEVTIYHPNFFSDADVSSLNPISETESNPTSYDLLQQYERYQQHLELEKEYWLTFSQLLKWSFRPQSCTPSLPEIAAVCYSDDVPTTFCPLQEQTFVYDTARVINQFVPHSVTTEATLSLYLPNPHLVAIADNFLQSIKGELLPILSLLLLISIPLPSIEVSSLKLVLRMLLCHWVILFCTAATLLVTYHTTYIDTESVLPQKLSKITKLDTKMSWIANSPSTRNASHHPYNCSVESVVTTSILKEKINLVETSLPPNFAGRCDWYSTWNATLLDILGPTSYCLTIAFALYTITYIHAIVFSLHVRFFLSDCYSITLVFVCHIFQLIRACISYSKRLAQSSVQASTPACTSSNPSGSSVSSSNYKHESFEESNMDEPIDSEWFEGDTPNHHRDLLQEIDNALLTEELPFCESYPVTLPINADDSPINTDDSPMNSCITLESDSHIPEPEECESRESPMIYHDPQQTHSCSQGSNKTTDMETSSLIKISLPEYHINPPLEKSALESPNSTNTCFKLQLPIEANSNVASGNAMTNDSYGSETFSYGDLLIQAHADSTEQPLLPEDVGCLHEVLPNIEEKLHMTLSDDSVAQYGNVKTITSCYIGQGKVCYEVSTQSAGVSNTYMKMESVIGGLSTTPATGCYSFSSMSLTLAVMKPPHSTYTSLVDKRNSFMEEEVLFLVFVSISRLETWKTVIVFSNQVFINRAMALSVLHILRKFRPATDHSTVTGYLTFGDTDHFTDHAIYKSLPSSCGDHCTKPNTTTIGDVSMALLQDTSQIELHLSDTGIIGDVTITLLHDKSQMEQHLSDISMTYDSHIRRTSSAAAQSHATNMPSFTRHSQTCVLVNSHAKSTCENPPLRTSTDLVVPRGASSPPKPQQVQLLRSNVSVKKGSIVVETTCPSSTHDQNVLHVTHVLLPDVLAEECVLSSTVGYPEFTATTTKTLQALCDSSGKCLPNLQLIQLGVQHPLTNRQHVLGQETLPNCVNTPLGKSTVQSLSKLNMNATTSTATVTTSDISDIQKRNDVVVLKQQSDSQYALSPEPNLVDDDIQGSNYIRSNNYTYDAQNIHTPLSLSQQQLNSASHEYPEETAYLKTPPPSTEDPSLSKKTPRCLPPDKSTGRSHNICYSLDLVIGKYVLLHQDSLTASQAVEPSLYDVERLYLLNGGTTSGTCGSIMVGLESHIFLTQSVMRCIGEQESSIPRESNSELVVGNFRKKYHFLPGSDDHVHQDSQYFVELGNGSEPMTIQIGYVISVNCNMLEILTDPSSMPAQIVHETKEATTLASSIDPSLSSRIYSSTIGLAEEDRESLTSYANSSHLLPSICREQDKGTCVYPPLPPLPSLLNPPSEPNEPAMNIVTGDIKAPTTNGFVDKDNEDPLKLHASPLPVQDPAQPVVPNINPPIDQTFGAVSVSAVIGQLSNNIDVSRGTSSSKPAVSHTKKPPPLAPTHEATEDEQVHVRSKFTERDKSLNSDTDEDKSVHDQSSLDLTLKVQQMPAKMVQSGLQQRPSKSLDSGFATKSSSNQPEAPTIDGTKPKQTPSATGSSTYFLGHSVMPKFGRPKSACNRLETDSLLSGSADTGTAVEESDPCSSHSFVKVNHQPMLSLEPLNHMPTSGLVLTISTTASSTADNPLAIVSFSECFGSADGGGDVLSQDNSKGHEVS